MKVEVGLYYRGVDGVAQSFKKAFEYFSKAAENEKKTLKTISLNVTLKEKEFLRIQSNLFIGYDNV